MEEGYPGNLHVEVKYVLRGSTLGIIYSGYSDADTIINLTNHMYFNLSGEDSILRHKLQVRADCYMPVDDECLVTGEDGSRYKDYEGIALETEYCPDSINKEKKLGVILRRGDTYHSETYYTFKNIRAVD